MQEEIAVLKESIVGAGPGSELDVQRTVSRIAAKIEILKPLSEAEYYRRRDEQKRKLEEWRMAHHV